MLPIPDPAQVSGPMPHTAYVSLWFPLPSETFIFREVRRLRELGLPVSGYALYGPKRERFSPEMRSHEGRVVHMGIRSIPKIAAALRYWRKRCPKTFARLWETVPFRRWSCLEQAGENFWCFVAGFELARKLEADKVELIHGAWGNGPATACLVASALTGIPYTFAGRAGDIHPPCGALGDKIKAAVLVRTNNAANIEHLAAQSPDDRHKIRLVYNALTLQKTPPKRDRVPAPPYRLLAIGRFCRTKGFTYLLSACSLLKKQGVPFKLTLVGDGTLRLPLLAKTRLLGLQDHIEFPGYVTHDRVGDLMRESDVFVMPSVIHASGDRDGIPNVIMEALACELPVVATNISGIPEVIQNGVTGISVAQRDPAALARAIRQTVENPAASAAMAKAGHELVLSMFDPAQNALRMLAFHREALSLGQGQRPCAE